VSPSLKVLPRRSSRIFHYYLPTYLWLLRQLEAHRARHAGATPPALVVRAPPGVGVAPFAS
jgi:hypothetical protein